MTAGERRSQSFRPFRAPVPQRPELRFGAPEGALGEYSAAVGADALLHLVRHAPALTEHVHRDFVVPV